MKFQTKKMTVETGSKPCLHCGKTISKNKSMCLEGITKFGTLENLVAMLKAREAEALLSAAPVVKKKRAPRKRVITPLVGAMIAMAAEPAE